jgi:hypothetical protein
VAFLGTAALSLLALLFSDLNMTFKFHAENAIPSGDWIWVFASNEAGKHAKGQARIARVNFRAEFGVGRGPTGHAYAIATQDRHLELLSLAAIEHSIGDFLSYARIHSELNFFVTRVACKGSSAGANGSGEGGYSDDPDRAFVCESARELFFA